MTATENPTDRPTDGPDEHPRADGPDETGAVAPTSGPSLDRSPDSSSEASLVRRALDATRRVQRRARAAVASHQRTAAGRVVEEAHAHAQRIRQQADHRGEIVARRADRHVSDRHREVSRERDDVLASARSAAARVQTAALRYDDAADPLRASLARARADLARIRRRTQFAMPGAAPLRSPRLGALAVLLLSAAVAITLVATHGTPLAVVATLIAACVLPGAGLQVALWRIALPHRAVTAVLTSLTWFVTLGLLFAWTTWHAPGVQLCLVLAPAVLGALTALRAPGPAPAVRLNAPRPAVVVGWAMLTVSVVAAVAAVAGARDEPIGAWGLLPALGPWFVVAVALATSAVVLGLALRGAAPGLSVPGLVVVLGLFTVPSAALADTMNYGWGYKHLGIVDLIAQHQPLSDPTDVLQRWPGFFAAAAQFQEMSGVDALHYANAAQALFVAIAALALHACARQLYGGRATAALATLLFLCSMWAGQFYFAPQSMAFALAMLVLVHLIAIVRAQPTAPFHAGWWGRWFGWTLRGLPAPTPLPRPSLVFLGASAAAAYLIVVVCHQMSPFVLVLQVVPLVLIGWLRGVWRWACLLLAAVPFVWLAFQIGSLQTGDVLNGFSFGNATSLVSGPSSEPQKAASTAARVVMALVLGGGLVVGLCRIRRLGSVFLALGLGAMPVFILAAGSYGGEAVYRVWLFGSPWFALVLAHGLVSLRRPALRTTALAITALLTSAMFLASAQATLYGMYPFATISDRQIAASRWLSTQTAPGSVVVTLGSTFPGRIEAGYVERNPLHLVNDPAVISYPQYPPATLAAMTPAEMAVDFRQTFLRDDDGQQVSDDLYLVIDSSMVDEGRYYGTLDEELVLGLADALTSSTSWDVAYDNGEVRVFTPR